MKSNFTCAAFLRRRINTVLFFRPLLLALFSLSVTFNYLHAQAPGPVWSTAMGNSTNEVMNGIASDAAGNMYYVGNFGGALDFDPGPGNTAAASSGSTDVFIWKLDATGGLLWIKTLGGLLADQGNDIQIDASGNIYITGSFNNGSDPVDFDPGPGNYPLVSNGTADAFVLKLNSSGDFVWAKNIGGTSTVTGRFLEVDGSGNIHVAGTFAGTADFDPDGGTYDIEASGTSDVFLLRLDASGTFLWAGKIDGPGAELITGVKVDASGNVYLAGTFSGTADFDPGPSIYILTAPTFPTANGYIVKLDPSGVLLWAESIVSTETNYVRGLGLDATGNLYASGQYTGTADLDPSSGTFSSTTLGGGDIFILKLDPSSGSPIWIKTIGASTSQSVHSLFTDPSGNVYAAGGYGTGMPVDFDPGPGTAELTGTGTAPGYLLKLDASGNYIYATQFVTGTSNSSPANDIQADAIGNVYLGGGFLTGDITIGSSTYINASVGSDLFIVKLSSITLPLHLLGFNAWRNDDQIHLKWITAQETSVSHFVVERSSDGIHYTTIGRVNATNSALSTDYIYPDTRPLTGTSYYRLKMIDRDGHFTNSPIKIVKSSDKGAVPLVYPIPAHDVLTISTIGMVKDAGNISIQLYSNAGQLLKSETMQVGGIHYLQVSTLPKGEYIIRLIGKNGYTSSHTVLVQ